VVTHIQALPVNAEIRIFLLAQILFVYRLPEILVAAEDLFEAVFVHYTKCYR
jgi:hypothetical protein